MWPCMALVLSMELALLQNAFSGCCKPKKENRRSMHVKPRARSRRKKRRTKQPSAEKSKPIAPVAPITPVAPVSSQMKPSASLKVEKTQSEKPTKGSNESSGGKKDTNVEARANEKNKEPVPEGVKPEEKKVPTNETDQSEDETMKAVISLQKDEQVPDTEDDVVKTDKSALQSNSKNGVD